MKKISTIAGLFILFTMILTSSVFAQDESWVPFTVPQDLSQKMECTIVPPIGPDEQVTSVLPPVSDEDWSIGAEDAPLTIVEYADFQCSYCARAGLALAEFQKKYPDQVRYVYRHFPLNFHEKAPMAAYAADAAGRQGKFFEAEDVLYLNSTIWSTLETLDEFEAWLKENFPKSIEGLDMAQWEKDFADPELRSKVDGAFDEVVATGIINGTPTVFLNWNFYQGSMDEATLKKFLELFKLQKRLYSECPPMIVDTAKQYRAIIDTEKGQIVMELYADKAPLAVNSFIFLANEGWFDGTIFHRQIPEFVVQGGDPSGSGVGTPGYQFANETNDLAYGEPGWVGMANSGADKNGSQFFITFSLSDYYQKAISKSNETASDEHKLTEERIAEEVTKELAKMSENYTIFGKVVEGLDVAENLAAGTLVLSVKIEEKQN
jgi:cyclophilin family peptidyl-prolyl cis-trans isomerase/protein-disulfide isomerase